MKTELILRENNASLIITAESEFEKKSLESLERLEDKSVHLSVESHCYGSVASAKIVVSFLKTDK